MLTTPSISTFLWYDADAEAAAQFYTTLFPNSRITKIVRCGEGGPAAKGSVMTVAFELGGHSITAINGGPHYTLTPAASLVVSCDTQQEIDHYWDALISDGGRPSMCGWLEDRFGLSWQVVPSSIGALLGDADAGKAGRVGRALMTMQKLDLAVLQRAHRGEESTAAGAHS